MSRSQQNQLKNFSTKGASQRLAYLLPDPAAPGLIPTAVTKNFQWKNTWCCQGLSMALLKRKWTVAWKCWSNPSSTSLWEASTRLWQASTTKMFSTEFLVTRIASANRINFRRFDFMSMETNPSNKFPLAPPKKSLTIENCRVKLFNDSKIEQQLAPTNHLSSMKF